MQISRVTRVSNPRKSKRRSGKKNPKRLSLKQKLHFGTARQRVAAKAALRSKRSNPKRKRVVRKVKRRRRTSNPAHLITLGLVNPSTGRKKSKRRKLKNMATKTKRRRRAVLRAKSNPRRRARKNSVKVIVRRRRRASNPRSYKRRRRSVVNYKRRARRSNPRRSYGRSRRRNPALFGHQVTAFEMAKAIAGGLAGVAITKAVPNMLPAGIGGTAIMNTIIAIAVAVAAGMAVKALVKSDPILGDAVMFGGLMQAGSVALNSFLPSIGSQIGLQGLGNGMGDIVAGRFPVPQNPIMAGQAMLNAAALPSSGHAAAASGVGAIFNPFGRAM